jgi:uncharacterized RDD family membrane protein YckC
MEIIQTHSTNYASFLYRVLAFVIDFIILSIIGQIINAIFGVNSFAMMNTQDVSVVQDMVKSMMPALGASTVLQAAYYTFMESSAKQGTIGKIALGLKVVDYNGERITPTKAFLKYIGRIINACTCMIGYLLPLFTEKKQALHDMIGGAVVIKEEK